MRATRTNPQTRKQLIMDALIPHARAQGYQSITWTSAARVAAVSEATIRRYYGTLPQLHRAIILQAIEIGDARIVAQGVAAGDAKAKRAPVELLVKAASIIRAR